MKRMGIALIVCGFIILAGGVHDAMSAEQGPDVQFTEFGCEMYAGFVGSMAYYRDQRVPAASMEVMVTDELSSVTNPIPGMAAFLISELYRVYSLPEVSREVLAGQARTTCMKAGGKVSRFGVNV